jgi:PLD-like domain
MALSEIYANTRATDFTINFFLNAASPPKLGLLAAPFFSTMTAIESLTRKGCSVLLVVRFSPITQPSALRAALENPLVRVRYFTDTKFHTKLYIVDNVALVGSANLTESGLKSNRELSILLRKDRDVAFQELPTVFDELWNDADVLTVEILKEYTRAFEQKGRPEDEGEFAEYLKTFVAPVSPKSVAVGSEKVSKERAFIQSFRRKYDEVLIPAHNEILAVAQANGFGRPEYVGQDPQIEMGRFLGWLRLIHGSLDAWRESSILNITERAERIAHYTAVWQSTDDTVKGDMYRAKDEIENIQKIKTFLCNPHEVDQLSFDEIFDCLLGCHAFLERLRFASKEIGQSLSGIDRLRIEFQRHNKLDRVKQTINYLLSGRGDAIERAYDCIYSSKYRLEGFGEACVMELLGWGDPVRPPFNNRTIRGIRFLGFDVEHLVAGG